MWTVFYTNNRTTVYIYLKLKFIKLNMYKKYKKYCNLSLILVLHGLHQGFATFFQINPFIETEKAMAPFNKVTQKTAIINTKDLFSSSATTEYLV